MLMVEPLVRGTQWVIYTSLDRRARSKQVVPVASACLPAGLCLWLHIHICSYSFSLSSQWPQVGVFVYSSSLWIFAQSVFTGPADPRVWLHGVSPQ